MPFQSLSSAREDIMRQESSAKPRMGGIMDVQTRSMTPRLAAVAAVTGALIALGQSAPATAKDLIYGSWTPAVSYINRVIVPKVFKEIDQETNGAIKWKLIPGSQIVGPKDSFTAPGEGLVQAAFGIAIYVPNMVPSLNTIYSTLVFEGTSLQATPAALETFHLDCPSCLAEFKKANIVGLSGWTTSQYYLSCREPISKVEDLKGKRIRGQGGPAELWQMAGAVPVSSTLPESLSLLQRGGLDCMHNTWGWLQTFGYGDFAKYVTDQPMSLSGPAIGMMINRDTWNSFTAEQKKIHLRKAAYISAAEATGDFGTEQDRYLALVKKNKGVKLVKAENKGFEELIARFDKVQRQKVIEAAEKFGVKNPGAIIDAYKKNLAKWQKLTAGLTNKNTDKLDALIWEHIYSKIDVSKL
jgi:TRAP-type C4-dicarboxylate transport system substrate-binding protein